MKIVYLLLLLACSDGRVPVENLDNKVNAIFVDEFGTHWFGTEDYLLRQVGSDWIAYSFKDMPARINDIRKSPTGKTALWIATSHGILNFDYSNQQIYNIQIYDSLTTSLRTNNILSILFDSRNTGYFMTASGIGIFNDKGWKFYTGFVDILRNEFTSAGVKNDTIYLGTRGEGVARIFKNNADSYSGASSYVIPWSAIPNDTINCVLIDKKGNQWYGTNKGLCRHYNTEANEGWDLYYVKQLKPGKVTSLAEDSKGNIWAGTTSGLAKIESGYRNIKTWNKGDGLVSDTIFTLFIDNDDSVWIGTVRGASIFRNSRFSSITIPEIQTMKHYNINNQ